MATYTHLYTDNSGESHFEDVEIDLRWTDYEPPAPSLRLSSFELATQFGFMSAPAGWASDWHPSAARNLFFVISGEWEVTASDGETRRFGVGSDGETRRFGVGSVLLVEDTTGKGHSSRVISETDSLAVMVQLDGDRKSVV